VSAHQNSACQPNSLKFIFYYPRLPLYVSVASVPRMGLGLSASTSILRGQFVIEYAGEVISDTEAQDRWKEYSEQGVRGNYILVVQEWSGLGVLTRTNIDPTRKGNAAYVLYPKVLYCL
jgi:hypothetical protein